MISLNSITLLMPFTFLGSCKLFIIYSRWNFSKYIKNWINFLKAVWRKIITFVVNTKYSIIFNSFFMNITKFELSYIVTLTFLVSIKKHFKIFTVKKLSKKYKIQEHFSVSFSYILISPVDRYKYTYIGCYCTNCFTYIWTVLQIYVC